MSILLKNVLSRSKTTEILSFGFYVFLRTVYPNFPKLDLGLHVTSQNHEIRCTSVVYSPLLGLMKLSSSLQK
ncbi:hypothetical protein ACTXT7_017362, partial [Hymenolepis weldensis]